MINISAPLKQKMTAPNVCLPPAFIDTSALYHQGEITVFVWPRRIGLQLSPPPPPEMLCLLGAAHIGGLFCCIV